ncbi:MAG: 6-phosphofructokinase [Salibacteraceae bacterium]
MQTIKHIGVLTSGGDAPGMNAAVRAVVRMGIFNDLAVSGIYHGFHGLINDEVEPLNLRSVGKVISLGGTFLKSSRCEAFRTKEGRIIAANHLIKHGIDALIIIGGDGSMRGASLLSEEHGFPVVGIPGTIDNDIFGTDYTIGFDTAVNVALDAIDKIRDTATSHDRLFFVEVMGRDTGHIALRTAVASGAIAVLMPESPMSVDGLYERLRALKARNKTSSVVIVAEGNPTGNAFEVAEKLKELTDDYETRITVLGHIQRGGSPTANDRVLAAELGAFAVECLLSGTHNVMVGVQNKSLLTTDLQDATNQKAGFNQELYRISDILSR